MLGKLLAQYVVTIERLPATTNTDTRIRLTTWDARLDTTTVYEGSTGQGVSALVVRAYAEYVAEYE